MIKRFFIFLSFIINYMCQLSETAIIFFIDPEVINNVFISSIKRIIYIIKRKFPLSNILDDESIKCLLVFINDNNISFGLVYRVFLCMNGCSCWLDLILFFHIFSINQGVIRFSVIIHTIFSVELIGLFHSNTINKEDPLIHLEIF